MQQQLQELYFLPITQLDDLEKIYLKTSNVILPYLNDSITMYQFSKEIVIKLLSYFNTNKEAIYIKLDEIQQQVTDYGVNLLYILRSQFEEYESQVSESALDIIKLITINISIGQRIEQLLHQFKNEISHKIIREHNIINTITLTNDRIRQINKIIFTHVDNNVLLKRIYKYMTINVIYGYKRRVQYNINVFIINTIDSLSNIYVNHRIDKPPIIVAVQKQYDIPEETIERVELPQKTIEPVKIQQESIQKQDFDEVKAAQQQIMEKIDAQSGQIDDLNKYVKLLQRESHLMETESEPKSLVWENPAQSRSVSQLSSILGSGFEPPLYPETAAPLSLAAELQNIRTSSLEGEGGVYMTKQSEPVLLLEGAEILAGIDTIKNKLAQQESSGLNEQLKNNINQLIERTNAIENEQKTLIDAIQKDIIQRLDVISEAAHSKQQENIISVLPETINAAISEKYGSFINEMNIKFDTLTNAINTNKPKEQPDLLSNLDSLRESVDTKLRSFETIANSLQTSLRTIDKQIQSNDEKESAILEQMAKNKTDINNNLYLLETKLTKDLFQDQINKLDEKLNQFQIDPTSIHENISKSVNELIDRALKTNFKKIDTKIQSGNKYLETLVKSSNRRIKGLEQTIKQEIQSNFNDFQKNININIPPELNDQLQSRFDQIQQKNIETIQNIVQPTLETQLLDKVRVITEFLQSENEKSIDTRMRQLISEISENIKKDILIAEESRFLDFQDNVLLIGTNVKHLTERINNLIDDYGYEPIGKKTTKRRRVRVNEP